MATSVELRRYDYGTAGVFRTSESDTRGNLTGIKLQVEQLQISIVKDLITLGVYSDTAGSTQNQWVTDLGIGKCSITVKGIITRDATNSVDGIVIMQDLQYAVENWFLEGVLSLVWTDEQDGGQTITYTGFPINANFQYSAGTLGVFPFAFQFIRGSET